MRHSHIESTKVKIEQLQTFDPLTDNQQRAFDSWKMGNNLILSGSAGTGKTFAALYLALEQSLDKSTPYDEVRIIRSIIPTNDPGHLPGTIEEKLHPYSGPYVNICCQLFDRADAYDLLVRQNDLAFESTSYLRGMTFDNSIVIVDEMQNLNFHELDSVITRIGNNSRLILCGDYYQSDFRKKGERDECLSFIQIAQQLRNFTHIEFTWDDIVRSDFVRDYIMTKEVVQRGVEYGPKKF